MLKSEWGFGIFALQGMVMAIDEFHFHRKRGLPNWERFGHPVDTLTVLLTLLWIYLFPPTVESIPFYIGLAALSCLVVTKDEFVHAKVCSGGEQWLHSILFILHPLLFLAAAWLWPLVHSDPRGVRMTFAFEILLIGLFLIYQVVYWICGNFGQKRL